MPSIRKVFDVSIKGEAQLAQRIKDLGNGAQLAAVRAINFTARRGRTEAVALVKSKLNLPVSYIRENLQLQLATRDFPRAVLYANKRPVLLGRFAPKQLYKPGKTKSRVKAGVSVLVGAPSGGYTREDLPNAFIIPSLRNSGAIGVAGRLRAGQRARFPIEVYHGPSVDQVFGRKREEQVEKLRPVLQAELKRQLDLLIKNPRQAAA